MTQVKGQVFEGSLNKVMKTREFIKGNIFIIPNSACTKNDFLLDSYKGKAQELLLANGIQNDDEKLIQIWFFTSGNDKESNWVDHTIDGYDELKYWKPSIGYLPASLFAGKDDGDVVTVNLPIEKYDCDENITMHTTIKVQLKLDQLNAPRYRNYGSFAEVLKRVTA